MSNPEICDPKGTLQFFAPPPQRRAPYIYPKKIFNRKKHKSALFELFLKLQSPRVDEGLMEVTVENEVQR